MKKTSINGFKFIGNTVGGFLGGGLVGLALLFWIVSWMELLEKKIGWYSIPVAIGILIFILVLLSFIFSDIRNYIKKKKGIKKIDNQEKKVFMKKPFLWGLIIGIVMFFLIIGIYLWPYLFDHDDNLLFIEYREYKADITNFDYIDTSKSSFIEGAWFDADNEYMIINLNGKNYQKCRLPEKIWEEFKVANSFGTYYNSQIEGKYTCTFGSVPDTPGKPANR
ncbi:MAG: KTSC domain-containing protein [Patescibacteria group bacterium]